MFEIILLIAIFSTAVAGLWDLKTTEVPDQIPAIMIISGISYWFIFFVSSGNYIPLIFSLLIGSILLGVGILLYKKGQWGGADAWILAAIGYMIPFYKDEIFIIPYLLNFFIISAIYMIIYAIVIGILHKKIFSLFKNDIKKNWKIFVIPFLFLFVFYFFTLYLISNGYNVSIEAPFYIFLSVFGLTLFWRYAKIIEEKIFKKKIPVSKLKAGDVLIDMNWVGLTERQVSSIKRRRKYVTIKEGVRFVPVFFLTLIITLIFGNLMFIFLGF